MEEKRRIGNYGKEINELREKGLTHKEIGEELGFKREQIKKYFKRERERQKKLSMGVMPKRKGRVPTDYVVKEDRVAELQYILYRKEARIKRLEMENELMRDFLSLTERK